MPRIGITASFPSSEGHDSSHADDFLGLTFTADDTALDEALAPYPNLPRFFGYYGVPMKKAVRILNRQGREQDVVYWERVVGGPVLWIPHDCARVLG